MKKDLFQIWFRDIQILYGLGRKNLEQQIDITAVKKAAFLLCTLQVPDTVKAFWSKFSMNRYPFCTGPGQFFYAA